MKKESKALFKRFMDRIVKLGIEDKDNIIGTYIYAEISPSFFMQLFKQPEYSHLTSPPEDIFGELLNHEPVFTQVLIVLTIMEVANTEKEFKKLYDKRKNNMEPDKVEGFDKILKGILKVPKPKDDKKGQ